MRFTVVSLLILFFALGAQADEKKRIAVLDFEYGTVRSAAAAIFGSDLDIGVGIRDLLTQRFVEGGVYAVVERAALEAVLSEQSFSNSDRANPATAAQLGRILGVDAIVMGSITQFGRDDQSRKIDGGAFGGFGRRAGIGGVKVDRAKAVVGITARMVDVNTAEILAVSTGEGESDRGGTSLYGSGRLSGAGGMGGIDMASANFGNTLIGEAVNKAVSPIVEDIQKYSDRIERHETPVEGLVADYDAGIVILNVGADAGVNVGDRLAIKRTVREVRDPASGKIIRRIEEEVGEVEITEADASSSVGRFSGSGTPEVGDAARK